MEEKTWILKQFTFKELKSKKAELRRKMKESTEP